MLKKIFAVALAASLSCVLLAGCASSAGSSQASSSAASSASASASSSQASASSSSASSASSDTAAPITADKIADGTYSIEVKSSSSMFRIVECELTVADGRMTALMTLSAHGYEKLFLGTSAQAAEASDDQFIMFTDEDNDGRYSYLVPVEALDAEIECAAFSINKQEWYDRTLVFKSDGIPAESISR